MCDTITYHARCTQLSKLYTLHKRLHQYNQVHKIIIPTLIHIDETNIQAWRINAGLQRTSHPSKSTLAASHLSWRSVQHPSPTSTSSQFVQLFLALLLAGLLQYTWHFHWSHDHSLVFVSTDNWGHDLYFAWSSVNPDPALWHWSIPADSVASQLDEFDHCDVTEDSRRERRIRAWSGRQDFDWMASMVYAFALYALFSTITMNDEELKSQGEVKIDSRVSSILSY